MAGTLVGECNLCGVDQSMRSHARGIVGATMVHDRSLLGLSQLLKTSRILVSNVVVSREIS
jgi:hypothetical protein